jgi:RimJ/RimL family protein N-acetyltransferase
MFARTDRLLLRPGWAEDEAALTRAIADEAIVRNLASAPWPYTRKDAKAFLTAHRDPNEPCFVILRRTMGAPELIGVIGISPSPDCPWDLGYFIARPHWGLGYATEAAAAVIAIAREGLRLPALTAGHFLDNPASGRVLAKLGFRPTGEVSPRFSAGRGSAAPCRHYRLDLSAEAETPELEPVREMIAA